MPCGYGYGCVWPPQDAQQEFSCACWRVEPDTHEKEGEGTGPLGKSTGQV